MSGIFISYRREDSQELAGRLFDRLTQRFGKDRVFRDIDTLDPGAKFAQVIAERIKACDVLIALIGRGWLVAKDADGRRRLDLQDDFVKTEIAEALTQNKLVIPVLVEGTPMPARDALPSEIAALAARNALPISDTRFDFDVGRLTSAIDKVLPSEQSANASTGPRASIVDRRLVVPAGLLVLAVFGVFWQWDRIVKLPRIEPLVSRLTERPLPRAIPGKFNIGVSHLEGDENETMERLVVESLGEFPSIATLSFDRRVASAQSDRSQAEREGHERARALLAASGADVLIWGVVLRQGDRRVPKLFWTPAVDVAQSRSTGRYPTTEALSLPNIFWQDLTSLLGLLAASSAAEFAAQEGRYTADKLEPFIERVRVLLRSINAEQWTADTHAQVLTVLATALTRYGQQSGQNEPLLEAVAICREALTERTRDRVPADWAATQNTLGNALSSLGERESNPARLTEAVQAYREALKERTREKAPLEWAMTQNNLGRALMRLGEREAHPRRLAEAIDAYREALKELTREKVPLQWAMTQNNLGSALLSLGERESDSTSLKEALAAYREALKERTREKVPLDWAMTQNNLGSALSTLGELEADRASLAEAVTAYREALKERTRERVPLDWAMTQNNLGNALSKLAQRDPDSALLDEAVAAHQEALTERTREKVPLDWAMSQNNLGNALSQLGMRDSDSARLEAAANAYEGALLVFRAAGADYQVQVTTRNLQSVRRAIKQQTTARNPAQAAPK
jgi:tetratricopeptide (TPR) repeat protein